MAEKKNRPVPDDGPAWLRGSGLQLSAVTMVMPAFGMRLRRRARRRRHVLLWCLRHAGLGRRMLLRCLRHAGRGRHVLLRCLRYAGLRCEVDTREPRAIAELHEAQLAGGADSSTAAVQSSGAADKQEPRCHGLQRRRCWCGRRHWHCPAPYSLNRGRWSLRAGCGSPQQAGVRRQGSADVRHCCVRRSFCLTLPSSHANAGTR